MFIFQQISHPSFMISFFNTVVSTKEVQVMFLLSDDAAISFGFEAFSMVNVAFMGWHFRFWGGEPVLVALAGLGLTKPDGLFANPGCFKRLGLDEGTVEQDKYESRERVWIEIIG